MSGRDNHYRSPVLPFEYPLTFGEPIEPCHDCLPWSVEIVADHPHDGDLTVREWHAIGCEIFEEETE